MQHKVAKVITLKGKKNVGTLTSAERGHLITVVTCMNASGSFVPPLIVWPRKNMQDGLMDGTPSGSIAACHPSGWIQTDIFTMWFNQFLKHVKPSQDDPVLLLLDGHNSHTRNMDVIDKAREHHVSIICLPPHSSHKMQPLDVSFMFPLKTFYAQAIEDWLHSNPGKVVTNFKVGRLFGIAYNRAATMNNSINGFKKTGLFPLNKNAFGDEDFPIHTHNSVSSEAVDAITPTGSPQPCSSSDNVERINQTTNSNKLLVTPEEINPLPTLAKNDPSKPTRARKAEIITSTPYKNKLAESINKKAPASLKKTLFSTGNKRVGKGAPTGKGEMVENTPLVKIRRKNKPNYNDDDLSSIEDDERLSPHDNSDDSIDDNDAECLFCGSLFSEDKGGEQWRQCRRCQRWAHEDCGADELFVCKQCEKFESKNKK